MGGLPDLKNRQICCPCWESNPWPFNPSLDTIQTDISPFIYIEPRHVRWSVRQTARNTLTATGHISVTYYLWFLLNSDVTFRHKQQAVYVKTRVALGYWLLSSRQCSLGRTSSVLRHNRRFAHVPVRRQVDVCDISSFTRNHDITNGWQTERNTTMSCFWAAVKLFRVTWIREGDTRQQARKVLGHVYIA